MKKEAFLLACVSVMLLIWVLLLEFAGTPLQINWEAMKKLPDAVSIFVIISFVFTKWLWRWRLFRGWLVQVPDLQGTWEGDFQSTWIDPKTNQRIPSRPMILVVRQTFRSISCTVFTAESESFSRAAQIALDEEAGSVSISYNYTNRSKATLRDVSPIHDGAAHLRVISIPAPMLEGEYWTGRCTTGHMALHFRSRELLESFPGEAGV